ncbi:MAG: response regulator [Desulfitobacterium sp.]|nr:response regulator [Desulfitobacterium sp.]
MAKILVVDDQMGVRRLLFEAFSDEGHVVEMAENGAMALEILKDFSPELIIMDMKMPEKNGIDTLREIRSFNKDVEVIMMTAYGDSKIKSLAEEHGIKYYVNKPFDLFELRDTVREILKGNQTA